MKFIPKQIYNILFKNLKAWFFSCVMMYYISSYDILGGEIIYKEQNTWNCHKYYVLVFVCLREWVCRMGILFNIGFCLDFLLHLQYHEYCPYTQLFFEKITHSYIIFFWTEVPLHVYTSTMYSTLYSFPTQLRPNSLIHTLQAPVFLHYLPCPG